MQRSVVVTGTLALALLLGSGSCIVACGCGLPPASAVRGAVRAEGGEGVGGAALDLRRLGTGGWTETTTSAAHGGFQFGEVPSQGDYALTVQPPAGWTLAPGQAASARFWLGAEDSVRVDFVLRAP